MVGILNISEGSTIALHATMLLSRQEAGPLTTMEAAQTLKVSAAHLSKVFQRLTKAGIVRAVRGPKGGYLINRPMSEIKLRDIFEAIEGPMKLKPCLLKEPHCGIQGCMLGSLLNDINQQVVAQFDKRLSEIQG
jgi:Rrf2 family protein